MACRYGFLHQPHAPQPAIGGMAARCDVTVDTSGLIDCVVAQRNFF